jgi:hypothetical protein
MMFEQSTSLRLPSFLHGTYRLVQQKTKREGLRCGARYLEDGSFAVPLRMEEVPSGELVMTHEVADFQREQSAWRLYMVSEVMSGLREALDWRNTLPMRDAYEAFFLDTAWGALYFSLAQMGPVSAERTARRLRAVLRFWQPLQSARYLFKSIGTPHRLDDLMVASCDWALDAWCPVGGASVPERLEMAAARMARATREDCIEAMLRELPRALEHAGKLKHRAVVADPVYQRERLATLDSRAFERVSGARTAELIAQLHDWDHELGVQ